MCSFSHEIQFNPASLLFNPSKDLHTDVNQLVVCRASLKFSYVNDIIHLLYCPVYPFSSLVLFQDPC